MLAALVAAMQAKDPALCEHGLRTAAYAVALGRALELSGSALVDLHYAAVLHDIGLLTVREELLVKDGPLSADEYVEVQCHPRAGAALLAPLPFLRHPAILIAHHHEHWDGSGYPYGLRGRFIPLGSRILAVADLYDAVQRHNRRSALALLQMAAGSRLDPELVTAFSRHVTNYGTESSMADLHKPEPWMRRACHLPLGVGSLHSSEAPPPSLQTEVIPIKTERT